MSTVRKMIMNGHPTPWHISMLSKSMKHGQQATAGVLTLSWAFGRKQVKILSISRPRPCICKFIRLLSIILTARATMSRFNGSTLSRTKTWQSTLSSAICSMSRMGMLMETPLWSASSSKTIMNSHLTRSFQATSHRLVFMVTWARVQWLTLESSSMMSTWSISTIT